MSETKSIMDRIDLPARSNKGTTGFRTTHVGMDRKETCVLKNHCARYSGIKSLAKNCMRNTVAGLLHNYQPSRRAQKMVGCLRDVRQLEVISTTLCLSKQERGVYVWCWNKHRWTVENL